MIWCSCCDVKMRGTSRGATCPVCSMCTKVTVRNRVLEELASHMTRSCCFKFGGCKHRGNAKEMRSHTLVCPFEAYRCDNVGCDYVDDFEATTKAHKLCCAYQLTSCPDIYCAWQGAGLDVHDHLSTAHNARNVPSRRQRNDHSCIIHCHVGNLFVTTWMRRLFRAHETSFLVTWKWGEAYPEGHQELTVWVQTFDPSLSGKFRSTLSVQTSPSNSLTYESLVTNTQPPSFPLVLPDSVVWGCLQYQHPDDDRYRLPAGRIGVLPDPEEGGCYITVTLVVNVV